MKFLPRSFRETQKDWYGKKGKSWHVTVAVTRGEDGELQTKTYVHVFDQCTQNWFAVHSIIENTLTTIRRTSPEITEAFIRSDNAGCYHSGFLAVSIPSISQRTEIVICRYDFSKPQSGKDVCDRRIAAMKAHMRRYVNEGNDIQSASDIKAALETFGGVKGCYVAVVAVDETQQTTTKHGLKGIQSFHNFRFESSEMTSQMSKMGSPQGRTQLQILEDFGDPEHDFGIFRKKTPAHVASETTHEEEEIEDNDEDEDKDEDEDEEAEGGDRTAFFSCPEKGCTKQFLTHRSLLSHLDSGKHHLRLERESSYDNIKRKWAKACQDVVSAARELTIERSLDLQLASGQPTVKRGWALKRSKKAVRFTEKVKRYLTGVCLEGEQTGKKADPSEVATRLKSLRSDGRKKFASEEWLTTQQITSYFSRLTILNRSGELRQQALPEEPWEEELKAICHFCQLETLLFIVSLTRIVERKVENNINSNSAT
ncbi:uncharacterized protein LOC116616791 [Nematostella vectensis]|uniref:uncharacterized protein LOC116616791 n=1 Tax=Nematostella vectensis TaxID=45351 RepID=UPI0020777918|nr:uncharacterized protein LOC116616791 [Nematostella vectensis]